MQDTERAFRRALPIDDGSRSRPAATVLEARSDATPTSDLLPRVVERRRTRRRRPARAAESGTPSPLAPKFPSGFPVPQLRALPDEEPRATLAEEDGVAGRCAADVAGADADGRSRAGAEGREGGGDGGADGKDQMEGNTMEVDFGENDRMLASMSAEQLRESVAQIHAQLRPEHIEMLRKRGMEKKQKSLPSSFSQMSVASGESTAQIDREASEDVSSETESLRKPSRVTFDDEVKEYPSAHVQPVSEDSAEYGVPIAPLSNVREAFTGGEEHIRRIADVVKLEHVAREQKAEEDKLAWTTPADEKPTTTAHTSHDLDAAVKKSLSALGDLATWRFGLSGERLSEEEMRTLPTHLGLHHHGTEPDVAGYTIGDLLLLTRSSMFHQRELSMRILGHVISKYGDDVVVPLSRAGGLTAMMADANLSNEAGDEGAPRASSRVGSFSQGFLKLVASLVDYETGCSSHRCFPPDSRAMSPELLYFVSDMYVQPSLPDEEATAPGEHQSPSSVMKALSLGSCVRRLVSVAVASCGNVERNGALCEALELLHFIATSSRLAASCVFEDEASVHGLHSVMGNVATEMTTEGKGKVDFLSRVVFLVSETLAACTLAAGWEGRIGGLTRRGGPVHDSRLERLGGWVESVQGPGGSEALRPAMFYGALRVFRSALVFGQGQDLFGELIVPKLPLLLGTPSPEMNTSTVPGGAAVMPLEKVCAEAYLALETYAHGLFGGLIAEQEAADSGGDDGRDVRAQGTKEDENSNDLDSRATRLERVEVAKSKLQLLVPMALDAATVFAGVDGSTSHVDFQGEKGLCTLASYAAAGHFAATILAMTAGAQVFLSTAVISRISTVASVGAESAAVLLSRAQSSTTLPYLAVAVACSVAHAAARVLVRGALSVGDVTRSRRYLCDVVERVNSGDAASSEAARVCNSVACNSYAEWLGLASTVHPSAETALAALGLVGRCTDAQVTVDVFRRCILSPSVFQALDSGVTKEKARSLADASIPRLVTALLSKSKQAKDTEAEQPPDKQNSLAVPVSSRDFLAFLVGEGPGKAAGVAGLSILQLLRQSGVASAVDVYQAVLLGVPASSWLDGSAASQGRTQALLASVLLSAGNAVADGEVLLPPGYETSLSDLSTKQSSRLATKVMALGEALVGYGPPAGQSAAATALASAIFSTLLRPSDADSSLRRPLWRLVISDCGGTGLFENARVFGNPTAVATDALARDYAELLAGGRAGAAASFVWEAVRPALLLNSSSVEPLVGTSAGRAAVREWIASGGAGLDGKRIEEHLLDRMAGER